MPDPTLRIAPSEDRGSATLRFADEEDAVEMTVSTQELDAMIEALAAARAALVPPVPPTHANAAIHRPVPTRAVVPAERVGGRRVILFRHPGYGWLAFELTAGEGADLAAGISAAMHADRAAGLT